MANLSDASGEITVKGVAKEFLEFLEEVQGEVSEAYYVLVDREDLKEALKEELIDNSISIGFSTSGRWNYGNNIDGYLNGDWLQDEPHLSAYNKFIEAVKKNNGSVEINYQDSDTATDWMGEGQAVLKVSSGEIDYSNYFESEDITVERFAEFNDETESWALSYLHGEEVAAAYEEYAEREGIGAVSIDDWYDEIYES